MQVSNIYDRGYAGPEKILSILSPLLKSKAINPKATLLVMQSSSVYSIHELSQSLAPGLSSSDLTLVIRVRVSRRIHYIALRRKRRVKRSKRNEV